MAQLGGYLEITFELEVLECLVIGIWKRTISIEIIS